MVCPRCGCGRAVVDVNFGVLPCMACQDKDSQERVRKPPEFYVISKRERIVRQRDRFAKDLLQPYLSGKPNPEFLEAYKEDREILDRFFTKEDLGKYEGVYE